MIPRPLVAGLAILLSLAFARSALAQLGGEPKVAVSAKASRAAAAPGDQLAIAVILNHAPGWHTHTNAPVVPPGLGDFQAIPTEVMIVGISGARAGPIQWPLSHEVPVNGPKGSPVRYGVFDGRAIAYIPIIVNPDATGEVSLTLGVGYQACDESVCLFPVAPDDPGSRVKVSIAVGPPGTPAGAADPDFAAFDPAVFAAMHDAATSPPVTDPRDAGGEPAIVPPAIGRTFLGFIHVPRADSAAGLAIVALLAALGGLVLNLTPCVLPVIPIKIMTISHHAGTPGKAMYLGLAMAAGVVSFWVALGILAASVFGITDPSVIFGIWYVTLAIGVLIGAMALGLMGMFTLNLPQGMYMFSPRADTAWGSFLFGVMTAVLGLPCFGFVAGALLAGSATLPSVVVLTIFASLGLGMASPYLVLSARPGLIDFIPRTGPGSELVKQVMGLLLLAAACFFIGSGLIALIAEQPHLSGVLHWWAVGIACAAAGLWLAYRTLRIARNVWPKFVFGIIGLIIAGAGISVALAFDRDARERRRASEAELAADPSEGAPRTWARYTPARLEAARAQGRIVVVDFTAEWCLNCKALEAAVLGTDAVQAAIAAGDVASFKADLTSRKDPGWAFLRELGQVGIPLLVVFEPGSETPVFASNAYTPDMVVGAIEAARQRQAPRAGDVPAR